ILRRAMRKDPDHRYGTALEMAEDLERYLRGEPILAAPSSLTSRLLLLSRRHRAASILAVALGAVILLLLGALGTGRYAQRRLFDADLARAHELLVRDGDPARARELLHSLRSRDDGERVESLERACAAHESLERFFDVVHEIDATRSVYDATVLEGRLERLLRTGALEVRRPWSDCVLALALHHLGDADAARERLAEAATQRETRAVVALRALVDGADPEAALAELPPTSADVADAPPRDAADDHVLVAVALRLADAPPPAIRREIERAMERRRDHDRAREALALLERREGNHAKALGLFLGLVTADGYRPVTLLHQAYEALLLGDLDQASRCLEQVPELHRDARHALMTSQVLRRRGRVDEARVHAEEACRRWPDDGELRAELGNALLSSGETPRATESFRAALEAGPRSFVRERVEGTLAACELRELLDTAPRGRDIGAELLARAARWSAAAARAGDPVAASDLHLVVARSRRLLGRHAEAWDALDRAISADPENAAASTTFALWAAERAINARMRGAADTPEDDAALRRAERYVDAIVRGAHPAGERALPDQCRQDAWYASFLLAWCRGDDAALERTLDLLPDEAPYYWTSQRESIEQLLGMRPR
ncbi:MAG: tetratricopeptide repeat protein, partial [Planctomycetota bacterium JB042]